MVDCINQAIKKIKINTSKGSPIIVGGKGRVFAPKALKRNNNFLESIRGY